MVKTVAAAVLIFVIISLQSSPIIYCIPSVPLSPASALDNNLLKLKTLDPVVKKEQIPCSCAVFLTGQFKKGSSEPPNGNPALLYEQNTLLQCTLAGNKQCTNRCLETMVKHLPNSPAILCGSIERDCHKERAYLFIQNCNSTWINTNLSAGREYCCKDSLPYKCPLI